MQMQRGKDDALVTLPTTTADTPSQDWKVNKDSKQLIFKSAMQIRKNLLTILCPNNYYMNQNKDDATICSL